MANRVVKSEALITAAIDFGTTFSGYAYSFKAELQTAQPSIQTNSWQGGKTISAKAPTSVLFDSHKKMVTFGYEAESRYSDICADEEHDQYYFFHRFKMMLHKTKHLTKATKLKEEGGVKEMPAIDVFAGAIQFLKTHLMDEIRRRVNEIHESDIQWVLTVPAIWDNHAKQFMREAAEKAGIAHDQLQIALEPEAASVYCQRLATERKTHEDGTKLAISEPNSKFMVLDLGGGTVDITVHVRQVDGSLQEIYQASGGAWGGTKVDEEFTKLLHEMFGGTEIGQKVMEAFKVKSMEDHVELLHEIEIKKRAVKKDGSGRTMIRIPSQLKDTFKDVTGNKLEDCVCKTKFGDKISLVGDRLKLANEVMQAMYKPSLDKIVDHVRDLFRQTANFGVKTVLLVGGFSSCDLVAGTLKETFRDKFFFMPHNAELAILIGAVLYGHDPGVISSRVCRHTYGIRGKKAFVEGQHPESKKEVIDGRAWCANIFYKLAEIGQTVNVGTKIHGQTFVPTERDQKVMYIPIFASSAKNPQYTTELGCQYLGKVVVDMPDLTDGYNREVDIWFSFAGTEMQVEARQKNKTSTYTTRVNFL